MGWDELAELSPEHLAEYNQRQDENVWGVGFKRDKFGKPIEQSRPLGESHRLAVEAEKKRLMQLAGVKE
jgi:hypothetical protein